MPGNVAGMLFIADTNNSVIRYLDLNNQGSELRTLELKGVKPPTPKPKTLRRLRSRVSADTLTVKADPISSAEGNLRIQISVPEGYHFSKEARSKFTIETEPEGVVSFDPSGADLDPQGSSVVRFKRSSSASASASAGRVFCKVYYCKEDEVCLYQSVVFEVPFQEAVTQDSTEATLNFLVKPRSPSSAFELPVTR